MDAYDYDDDMEGYGGKSFSSGGKRGGKKGKGRKQVEEENDTQAPEHFDFPDEEGQEQQAEEQGQQAQEEVQGGPSIQISFGGLPPPSPGPEEKKEGEFFGEEDFRNDAVVLETYDNWEDAMDALDEAVSKLEEDKANQKVKPAPPKKS